MAFDPNPAFARDLEADLAPRLDRASRSLTDAVRDNIRAGTRTGRKYARLPRRSSSASEFPQEQHSDLLRSVSVEKGEHSLARRAGFFGDTQGKLNAIEFGYAPRNMAARKPLARTLETRDVLRASLDAMRDGG